MFLENCVSIMNCAGLGVSTFPPVAVEVYPGGSGIPADFGFPAGGEFKSMTHCGGGGTEAIANLFVWQ